MPHTSYGILKSIRSHQISSPRVRDEIASGRPNACNLCHLDKTLGWTQTNLANWFNQPVQDLGDIEKSVADIPRLALTGDAGQRVIAAWHLSWPPALAISGTNWTTLFLAQLLDDNYAAVRCVAERSIKQVTDLRVPNYDYTIEPRGREAAREQLWTAWENEVRVKAPMTNKSLLMKEGGVDREQFDSLLRLRNNRVVRLRE